MRTSTPSGRHGGGAGAAPTVPTGFTPAASAAAVARFSTRRAAPCRPRRPVAARPRAFRRGDPAAAVDFHEHHPDRGDPAELATPGALTTAPIGTEARRRPSPSASGWDRIVALLRDLAPAMSRVRSTGPASGAGATPRGGCTPWAPDPWPVPVMGPRETQNAAPLGLPCRWNSAPLCGTPRATRAPLARAKYRGTAHPAAIALITGDGRDAAAARSAGSAPGGRGGAA